MLKINCLFLVCAKNIFILFRDPMLGHFSRGYHFLSTIKYFAMLSLFLYRQIISLFFKMTEESPGHHTFLQHSSAPSSRLRICFCAGPYRKAKWCFRILTEASTTVHCTLDMRSLTLLTMEKCSSSFSSASTFPTLPTTSGKVSARYWVFAVNSAQSSLGAVASLHSLPHVGRGIWLL